MIGHPAIAYMVAQGILDERREEASAYREAKAVVRSRLKSRSRSMRLGRYRLTVTKEVPGVPRTV